MATKIEDRTGFLRQHYAGQAMALFAAEIGNYIFADIPDEDAQKIARNAFAIADAMVAEANKARQL